MFRRSPIRQTCVIAFCLGGGSAAPEGTHPGQQQQAAESIAAATAELHRRLVRDISRKLGKEVELKPEGEETERDKNYRWFRPDPEPKGADQMSLEFEGGLARFSDLVSVEEAESLLNWLVANPQGAVDLSACTHLHAANLQILMAARPRIAAWPRDENLAVWLEAALNPESGS